jgi:hypothetical protein
MDQKECGLQMTPEQEKELEVLYRQWEKKTKEKYMSFTPFYAFMAGYEIGKKEGFNDGYDERGKDSVNY